MAQKKGMSCRGGMTFPWFCGIKVGVFRYKLTLYFIKRKIKLKKNAFDGRFLVFIPLIYTTHYYLNYHNSISVESLKIKG